MDPYLADIRRYDALADEEVVARIVRHLGIALRNRDSALVSCGDAAELERVREKWCFKKLGLEDAARADRAIELVCETMARVNAKSRVTFYYLCAKQLGRINAI